MSNVPNPPRRQRGPIQRVHAKYWCFTLNNPTEEPTTFIARINALRSVTACVFQTERGESGTEHWQGYIEMSKSRPMSQVKAIIRGNPHLEKRRGTAEQAIQYCKKPQTRIRGPWECGTFSPTRKPGQRTDLEAIVTTMETATSLTEVVREHPAASIRYSRGIKFTYQHIKAPTVPKVPNVWLFYGKTGTGKTRYAMQQQQPFKKSGSTQWFDGYDHQDTLIFDDFGGKASRMCLTDVLNYLDRYPVKLPVKGDFVDRNCSLIIVTTNIHPMLWYDYSNRHEHYDALARRFTRIIRFMDTGAFSQKHDVFFNDWCEHTEDAALTCLPEDCVPMPWDNESEESSEDAAAGALSQLPFTPPRSVPSYINLAATTQYQEIPDTDDEDSELSID